MSLTIVVGGQFGSEGKGKICSYLARETDLAIRAGGPNSGHTVHHQGKIYQLQQIPSTFINPASSLGIAAGAVIDLPILLREIELCDVSDRLSVDPAAMVIDQTDSAREADLKTRIGSTTSGTGAAIARKVLRGPDVRLAKDYPELRPYLKPVSELANASLDRGKRVLIEGSQGVGLSLHHGPYPYVTSRDTTPGALCSEVGVSPLLVTDVLMVLRTFPIRVSGNSGPLPDEIDWDTVTKESGSQKPLLERTTVTKHVRRVARFSWDVVEKSIQLARPTQIALNFVDYLDARNLGVTDYDALSRRSRAFIQQLNERLRVKISFLGTGPEVDSVVDLRPSRRSLQESKRLTVA